MSFDPSNKLFSVLTGTAIVVASVIYVPTIVSAKTPSEIAQIAAPRTVQINTPLLPGGSGVVISKQGNTYTVLTANHVVKRPDLPYTVRIANGNDFKEYPVSRIQSFQQGADGPDLAIVTFDSSDHYPTAVVGDSDQAAMGTDVYVAGYPAVGGRSGIERDFEFTKGSVTSRPVKRAQGYTLRYSALTRGGMSGGPVFDANGRVIGIHGQGDTEGSIQSEAGDSIAIKSGFNAAIPINTFLSMKSQTVAAQAPIAQDRTPSEAKPAQVEAPKTAKDFYVQGLSRIDRGDRRGATESFNQALQLDPNDATAHYYKGVTLYSQGQKQEAIASFSQAIQFNANLADAYYQRAVVRYELADKQGAIADFTEALRLSPNDVYAYQNRGIIRRSLNDGRGTLEDFDQVVRLAPSSKAYYNRALAQAMVNNQQGMLDDFGEAIRLEPTFTAAYINRAVGRRRMGDREGAIQDLTVAVQLESNNATAYYNRGILRRDVGDRTGAAEDLQRAMALFQQQGNTGNYQKALEAFERLQKQSGTIPIPNTSPSAGSSHPGF
jgi:tetratricopeptide (TPR) repeat protein/V8-like Glu-specific endopeptidase